MVTLFGLGLLAWFVLNVVRGFYTVSPNQRAVVTSFGRAQRIGDGRPVTESIEVALSTEEQTRFVYPQVRVIGPGIHVRLPWQRVHKVSIATDTVSIAYDPDSPQANQGGQALEAVTRDQLNTGFTGQLRFSVSERNLYAYVFAVKNPVSHVMGYFVSVLRDRVAHFEAPRANWAGEEPAVDVVESISINDLRKNISDLNDHMMEECLASVARYGIGLDAVLITGIDPPPEIESALAAINTAYNQVSSEISLAQAAADQKIVQSKRAVEIETLRALAEVEPLRALAVQLRELRAQGPGILDLYLRNTRLDLFTRTATLVTDGSTAFSPATSTGAAR
jgi:regulator of protease activity HflC (stomatin/prohibitin superfamily)